MISVDSLCAVLHTLAVFNYPSEKFVNYVLGILDLVRGHPFKHTGRLIWALCVLADKSQLARAYPICEGFFNRVEQMEALV